MSDVRDRIGRKYSTPLGPIETPLLPRRKRRPTTPNNTLMLVPWRALRDLLPIIRPAKENAQANAEVLQSPMPLICPRDTTRKDWGFYSHPSSLE